MNKLHVFITWTDAKHFASEASLNGHAWIVALGQLYRFAVIASENVDDAPPHYAAEFKEGVEQ